MEEQNGSARRCTPLTSNIPQGDGFNESVLQPGSQTKQIFLVYKSVKKIITLRCCFYFLTSLTTFCRIFGCFLSISSTENDWLRSHQTEWPFLSLRRSVCQMQFSWFIDLFHMCQWRTVYSYLLYNCLYCKHYYSVVGLHLPTFQLTP